MMSDSDFASYADDNTSYVLADTIDKVVKRLETASVNLFKWFVDNEMKANQDKSQLIVSENENVSIYIGPFEIKIPIVKNYSESRLIVDLISMCI